jgi:hypothetical protein
MEVGATSMLGEHVSVFAEGLSGSCIGYIQSSYIPVVSIEVVLLNVDFRLFFVDF